MKVRDELARLYSDMPYSELYDMVASIQPNSYERVYVDMSIEYDYEDIFPVVRIMGLREETKEEIQARVSAERAAKEQQIAALQRQLKALGG